MPLLGGRLAVGVAAERLVLVPREDLEDPLLVLAGGVFLLQFLEVELGILRAAGTHAPQDAGSGSSLLSASRAASCSAAFFEWPSPTPSWTPSTTAAQVKWRSWGGPSALRTE
jgi:hypothetical protein